MPLGWLFSFLLFSHLFSSSASLSCIHPIPLSSKTLFLASSYNSLGAKNPSRQNGVKFPCISIESNVEDVGNVFSNVIWPELHFPSFSFYMPVLSVNPDNYYYKKYFPQTKKVVIFFSTYKCSVYKHAFLYLLIYSTSVMSTYFVPGTSLCTMDIVVMKSKFLGSLSWNSGIGDWK